MAAYEEVRVGEGNLFSLCQAKRKYEWEREADSHYMVVDGEVRVGEGSLLYMLV